MVNFAIIQGTISSTPVVRNTKDGGVIVLFDISYAESFKGERRGFFVHCMAYDVVGLNIKNRCPKGSKVVVQGKIREMFHNVGAGEKEKRLGLVVTEATFLTVKQETREEDLDELDKELPF